jgi:heme exporter protein A
LTAHRLEIIDLSCARGDRPLLVDLNVEVNAGELLHVTGSNGSGKTTLLRTLCGLTRPAAGEVQWCGTPISKLGDEYRQNLVYVGHKDGIQGELTPPENLVALACTIGDIDARAANLALTQLGLAAYASFPSKILSQGQKRRLALARLLVARKPLRILDEPYTALDADSCRRVSRLLVEHLTHGGIAVLASHQSFEVPGAVIKQIDLDQPATREARRTGARSAPSVISAGRHKA